MAYLGNAPGVSSQRTTQTFTATAGQTTFSPTSGYTLGYLDVYLNGVRIINGTDYTASNGTTVVLASGAALDDVVEVVAYIPRGLSDGYTKPEADARYLGIDAETLPSQTGESGKYLTTDGSTASWATVNTSPTPADVSDQANASTGYFDLPAGTTAQRPGSPASGMVRFNTEAGSPEWYDPDGGLWLKFWQGSNYSVEYLIVAGGGGGGGAIRGGGGGAGGYRSSVNGESSGGGASSESPLTVNANTLYSVEVGLGGPSGPYEASGGASGGQSGQNSSFGGIIAIGGGGGGASDNTGTDRTPKSGGSGGGGWYVTGGEAGTVGQGYAGGNTGTTYPYGSGGGGAGQAGRAFNDPTNPCKGGDGVQSSINGTATYRAGGGSSAGYPNQGYVTNVAGGLGGGGTGINEFGRVSGQAPANGTTNTGGGGGASGNGGSGIVIIRYAGAQRATGGTVTSANGYTIHTFTSSGTFIA